MTLPYKHQQILAEAAWQRKQTRASIRAFIIDEARFYCDELVLVPEPCPLTTRMYIEKRDVVPTSFDECRRVWLQLAMASTMMNYKRNIILKFEKTLFPFYEQVSNNHICIRESISINKFLWVAMKYLFLTEVWKYIRRQAWYLHSRWKM